MSGYRRSEPAFCRGCGKPWTPGADECGACGEAMLVAPTAGGDPRAVPKAKAVLLAVSVVVAVRWLAFAFIPSWTSGSGQLAWHGLAGLTCATVLVLGPVWLPGGMRWPKLTATPAAWIVAAVGGVGLAVLLGQYGSGSWDTILTLTPGSVWTGDGAGWIALVLGGVVAEELLFRGVLVDGLTPSAGARNSAIASAMLYAVLTIHPALALLGIGAAALRAWYISVGPGIVLRLAAATTWLLWLGGTV